MKNQGINPIAEYGYIPGLNGIRALSVLIVLIAHMGLSHAIPGGFGVTVFFFISGFLITRILIAENEMKGRIKLNQFYIRRFIRLYPALLFMLFGTTLIYFLNGWAEPRPLEMFSAVFYGMNFYEINIRTNDIAPLMPWTHLWSLAVEEHFYLIFPLFLVFLKGNWPRILKGLVVVLIATLLWRVFLFYQTDVLIEEYIYKMTDTRIDSLVWGCLLSIMLHVHRSTKKVSWLIGYVPIVLCSLVILSTFVIRDEAFRYTARYSVQGCTLFVLFLNLFFSQKLSWVISILEWKPLAWFGTISYALYLWHVPVIDACIRFVGEGPMAYSLAFLISIYAAAFSYYIVEKRFLKLRKRFGSHEVTAGEAALKAPKLLRRKLKSL